MERRNKREADWGDIIHVANQFRILSNHLQNLVNTCEIGCQENDHTYVQNLVNTYQSCRNVQYLVCQIKPQVLTGCKVTA